MLLQIFGMFVFPQCLYMSYMLYIYMSIYIFIIYFMSYMWYQTRVRRKQTKRRSFQSMMFLLRRSGSSWFVQKFFSPPTLRPGQEWCYTQGHPSTTGNQTGKLSLKKNILNFKDLEQHPQMNFTIIFTIFRRIPFVGIYKTTCLGARQNRLSVGDLGVISAEICRKMLGSSGGLNMFQHMGVSKNNGTPKSSILIGFSIINHPFWGPTPIFGNIHISSHKLDEF